MPDTSPASPAPALRPSISDFERGDLRFDGRRTAGAVDPPSRACRGCRQTAAARRASQRDDAAGKARGQGRAARRGAAAAARPAAPVSANDGRGSFCGVVASRLAFGRLRLIGECRWPVSGAARTASRRRCVVRRSAARRFDRRFGSRFATRRCLPSRPRRSGPARRPRRLPSRARNVVRSKLDGHRLALRLRMPCPGCLDHYGLRK